MSKILRLLDLSFEAWATLDHTFHERLAGDLYEAIEDVRNENNTSPKEWYSMNKIYINEDIGYLPAGEALKHLTDDWICGGNVSHETILNMRDVISYLHSELQEYKTLHSLVAGKLGTANHKLMQIEDLAKRESGLTPRVPDVCPECSGSGKTGSIGLPRECPYCAGTGKRG